MAVLPVRHARHYSACGTNSAPPIGIIVDVLTGMQAPSVRQVCKSFSYFLSCGVGHSKAQRAGSRGIGNSVTSAVAIAPSEHRLNNNATMRLPTIGEPSKMVPDRTGR